MAAGRRSPVRPADCCLLAGRGAGPAVDFSAQTLPRGHVSQSADRRTGFGELEVALQALTGSVPNHTLPRL